MIIEPYRGFGSPSRLYIRGRTLKDKNILVQPGESRLNTFRDNFQRFNSDEVPHIPLHIQFGLVKYVVTTDREGYFLLDRLEGPALSQEPKWEAIQIESLPHKKHQEAKTHGELFIPSDQASFGIISDIDDTILKTDIAFINRALLNTFLKNPFQRKPIQGMSTWINALHNHGPFGNPVFYVSKSPWNIYSYLSQFLEINQFPKGPILLRDIGRQGTPKPRNAPGHKKEEIQRILDSYPKLSFILIGDIAGDDPMIYAHIQERYPGRILAVYIRDIDHRRKQRKFQSWLDRKAFPNLWVYQDVREAFTHAHEHGWVNEVIP